MFRRVSLALAFASALALAGCAGGTGNAAKVTGKVTLPDGSPLPGGRIDFHSAKGSTISGSIKGDGGYVAEVPPGEYKVSVDNGFLKGTKPSPSKGSEAMPGSDQKYVPINPRYARADTSGLSTKVKSGADHYDVPLQR